MTSLIQKQDLAAGGFSNNNTLAAGGIDVRVDATSTVGAAIISAIAAQVAAADTVRGPVALAVGANYPAPTNDTDATTPAYVKAALDAAVLALPGDKFLQGLASYTAATNVLVLNMSDGSTVSVDMTGLMTDAVNTITTGKVTVMGNDGVTVLGHLLPV